MVREVRSFGELVSKDPALHRLFELLAELSGTQTPFVLCGQLGTGRSAAAREVQRKPPVEPIWT